MRIVWFATAFLAGVASALTWGFAPGDLIAYGAFWALIVATTALIAASVLLRRNPIALLLLLTILFGMWRASAGPQEAINAGWVSLGVLDMIRGAIEGGLDRVIGGDEGGLATALLTGERGRLSTGLVEAFRSAGLSHILAISGLHVSLIGGAAMMASVSAIGRRSRFYLAVPVVVVVAYAALAGFAPPVTRAMIMFLAFIVGKLLGRGSHMLPAIALAAAVMVLVEPLALASLSFQLSFAAVLGIALVARRLDLFAEVSSGGVTTGQRNSILSRLRRFLTGSLVVSIAATLATAPLVAIHFDAVPIWGPVATLLVLPALPILIVSSLLASAASALAPDSVAFIVAVPAILAAKYSILVADSIARIPPGPLSTGSLGVLFAFIYYGVLFSAATWVAAIVELIKNPEAKRERLVGVTRLTTRIAVVLPYALAIALLLPGVVLWLGATTRAEDRVLSVTFLSLARGEAILIEAPNGNRMLVDAGGTPAGAVEALQDLIPPWDRRIDVVLVTHPDADHLGGMSEVVKRFEVGVILDAEIESESIAFAEWRVVADGHGNTVSPVEGMEIRLDKDVSIEFLASGCHDLEWACVGRNDASAVVKAVYGEVSFLLTGDIEIASELRLIATGHALEATVLKVAHHGSRTSSSESFINAVSPAVAVVAVGTENPFGHPHEEIWRRLVDTIGEDRVYRTDMDGSVKFLTDGRRLWQGG